MLGCGGDRQAIFKGLHGERSPGNVNRPISTAIDWNKLQPLIGPRASPVSAVDWSAGQWL